MAELSVPRLDFSTLGELPKTYRDARKEALAIRYEEEAPKLLSQLYAAQAPAAGAAPSLSSLPAGGQPAQPAPRSYGDAISSVESGGKYEALGPVTKTGDRAYGKYQVMGQNIGPWSKEVLGRELTPQEFASSPEAQDAVFKAKFGQYEQKYGPEGAAKAWFAGEKGMNNPNARDQLGTTVSAYADKFNKALGPQGTQVAALGGGVPAGPAPAPQGQQVAQAAPQQSSDGYTVIPTPSTPGMPQQLRTMLPQLLQNPQTRASAVALAQKYQNPEQWQLVKDQSGNVFSRNVQNGEMKMLDKSTFLSPQELEQKLAIAKAGATSIYTGDNSKKFDEELDKKSADRWSKIMDNADAAEKKLVDITSMREISKRIGSQGASADFKDAIGPYAEALGVNVDGLSDIQAYNSIIQRLAPQQRAPGSGSTSDVEFKGFLKSLPGAAQNPLAREMTLNTMEALARDELSRGEIASRLSTKEINRTQAEKELRALPDPMQGFVAWRKANPELYGQALKGGAVTADAGQTTQPQQKTQAIPQGAPQGTKQAPDGKFYAPDPARPGKYLEVR